MDKVHSLPQPMADELRGAYDGRRVLVTGHTGFKGAWLTTWLHMLGARVSGYALDPDTVPALFGTLRLSESCEDLRADVRDFSRLSEVVGEVAPEVVFHLAAQPLVRRSYDEPIETLSTNVMGTAHLLEAIRRRSRPCAVVIVTSDKCYENDGTGRPMREDDAMGGHDVYSMSKGAAELVVSSYRRSFFPPDRLANHGIAVASARAGNVVGGGDWARDRIVPDIVRALTAREPVPVRNPNATRPWQHVLEPLGGYLLLGARLSPGAIERATFCTGWNFGPNEDENRPVRDVVTAALRTWGSGTWDDRSTTLGPHEAATLSLSIARARDVMRWKPRWGFDETIRRTIEWYRAHHDGIAPDRLRALSESQIRDYMTAASTP